MPRPVVHVSAEVVEGEPRLDVDWADLAHRLGYADRSHLIRAFTRLVGHPPATYAREA